MFPQALNLDQTILGQREVEFVDILTGQFSNGEAREDLVSFLFFVVVFVVVVFCDVSYASSCKF